MNPPPEDPPAVTPDPDPPGEAPVDLSAILGSERELGAVADRRASWRRPENGGTADPDPVRMLAALAADVDDDTPLPSVPAAAPRRWRGRRWGVALAGVAAAVVGMTGVAAAGSNVFAPISGLFGGTPATEPVAGSHPPRTATHTATPEAPGLPRVTDDPAASAPRRHAEPRTTRYAPAFKNPAQPFTHRHRAHAESSPARSPGLQPTSTPTGGETQTPSPSPSATRTAWWPRRPAPSRGMLRLQQGVARVVDGGTPPDG